MQASASPTPRAGTSPRSRAVTSPRAAASTPPGPRVSRHPEPKEAPPCPIGRAADLLGDRWTLLILRNATVGMSRFDEFKADLGIADNILSTRLSRLVDAGILAKVPYNGGGRTRSEYRLTEAGAEILPVLHALAAWGERFTEPAEPRA